MNILLDTNIIIPLEDTSRILDSSFAELRKLSAQQQHCLYIHPIQFEDIKRDKILERQKIVVHPRIALVESFNPSNSSLKYSSSLNP